MGVDQNELRRRREADKPRQNSDPNTPFAAIPHRVIDSPAFADLTPSEVKTLLLLVRQLTKDNNGRLQATRAYLRQRGVGSEHTIQRSVRGLIAHGFVFRTKAGAYGQGAARYAVTWLSLTKTREGLTHVEWFRPCAWHSWNKGEPLIPRGAENPRGHGKKNPPKVQDDCCKNGRRLRGAIAESAPKRVAKSADDELLPVEADLRSITTASISESDRLVSYLAKLNEAGLGNGRHAYRVWRYQRNCDNEQVYSRQAPKAAATLG